MNTPTDGVGAGFEAFGDAFEAITADGTPAALQVRRDGRVVVDLTAGTTRDGRPFTARTPVFLYSAVKPVTALCALVACADGRLDLDAPVAGAWHAFGAHGKDRVTVRRALAHGAAVPGWPRAITLAAFADRVAAADALAASEPWWPPGEPGEHAVSYGHLVDGILRHATGRDIVAWWSEVAAATGCRIDLLPGRGDRTPAPLEDPGGRWRARWLADDSVMGRLLRNPPDLLDVEVVNASRTLVAPAVTGYAAAADLAALWSWWTSPAAVRRLGAGLRAESLAPQVAGRDHVLDVDVAWGLGPQVDATSVGMGGVGGCVAWVERGPGLTVAFTTPRVGPVERLDPLDEAAAVVTG